MSNRKLTALGYPGIAQFNIEDEVSVRNLVVWLEENVFFTELSAEILTALRDGTSPQWNQVFAAYLSQCLCPFDPATERTSCVDWLLREAVRLVAEEAGDQLDNNLSMDTSQGSGFLAGVNVESQDVQQAVDKMASLVQIPSHPNPSVTLQAVVQFLLQHYSMENQQKENMGQLSGVLLPLEKVTLGFDMQGNLLSDGCKIARLLHIQQLRQLQTQMDIAMVSAQAITANPKTDELLGRTGF